MQDSERGLDQPYNPLEKRRLAESVVGALLDRPVSALPPPRRFFGAGIYVLYYTGGFPAYRPLAERNAGAEYRQPIYVGSAVPEGARKGLLTAEPRKTHRLYNRLGQHATSITRCDNLDLGEFFCRYLVVDDIWIPLAESLLIEKFTPVWNVVIDGFGIHDPGAGRRNQARSAWDALHPGRPFAMRQPPHPRRIESLVAEVERFLAEPAFAEQRTEEMLDAKNDGSVV